MSPTRRRRTACGTCVRRKVKCDETHPVCNRCKKGKFVCEGYEPKIVFVEENPASYESSPGPVSRRSKSSSPEATSPSYGQTTPGPSQSLSLSPWQAHISVVFTMENLFRQRSQGLFQDDQPTRSWLELALTHTKSTEINMDSAIGALCLAYFGKRHQQQGLVLQSNVRYGRARTARNQNLGNPDTAASLETLRDTKALVVYEAVVFTAPANWMHHADGIAKLFQLRGPESFRDPLSLHIFLSCRMIIILQRLTTRTPCFLAEPEWLELPSVVMQRPRSLHLEVQDLLTFVPGMLAELESFKQPHWTPEEMATKHSTLLHAVMAAISHLFQWRYRWEAENPGAAYSVPSNPALAGVESPFKRVIHFDSLENAHCIMTYGGAFITLYEMGEALCGHGIFDLAPAVEDARQKSFSILPASSDPPGLLSLPAVTLNAEMLAYELCAMTEFHFEEAHRGMGAFVVIWPLKLSEHVLGNQPIINRWIKAMLDRIAGEDALEVVRAPLRSS